MTMYPTSIMLIAKPNLGDANADGIVDSADLSALEYGQTHGLSGWNNGDFNQDGLVNQDDVDSFEMGLVQYDARIILCQATTTATGRLMPPTTSHGAKGLGTIYVAVDYDLWRLNFGKTISSTAAVAIAAVPEPAALVLLILAIAALCPRRWSI